MKKTLILVALVATMLLVAANAFAFKCENIRAFDISPNPMDDHCTIHLELSSSAYVYLRVETLEGEVVADIYNGVSSKEMNFDWDRYSNNGQYAPNGTYMVVLSLDQRYTSTKKTLILK